jgi:HptB-dependent secretion and biofilm anti anti-sigma factor
MELSERAVIDGTEIMMSGKFTLRDHDRFRSMVATIPEKTGSVVFLDISGLEFVDSAGLGLFLLSQETARACGKQVVLRHPKPHVRRLLEVACFHTLFTIE